MKAWLRFVVVATLPLIVMTASPLLARTWTDRKGRQVEADFVAFEQGKLVWWAAHGG